MPIFSYFVNNFGNRYAFGFETICLKRNTMLAI